MKEISEFRGLFIEFKLKINCDNILKIVSEGKFWFFVDFAVLHNIHFYSHFDSL